MKTTYKELENGSIQQHDDHETEVPSGTSYLPVKQGDKRQRPVTIDDSDQTEEYEPYAELLAREADGEIEILWITDQQLLLIETEKSINKFKADRQSLVNNSIVTTESGLQFNGDEQSVSRILGKLHRLRDNAGNKTLGWVLADSDTGIKTTITKAELEEAYDLATDYIDQVWGMG